MTNDYIEDPPPPAEWKEEYVTKKELNRFYLKLVGLVVLEIIGFVWVTGEINKFVARNYGTAFHINVEIVKGEKK